MEMLCGVVPKPYWIFASAERKFAKLDASDFSSEQGVKVCNKKKKKKTNAICDYWCNIRFYFCSLSSRDNMVHAVPRTSPTLIH